MKKTVIVNISGIIFHIDEDAYGKLSAYIDALHRYFDKQTEGKEIVSDIESRIAELLQPLINETKQSVTIEDVESIIVTLGKPEDIAGAGENEDGQNGATQGQSQEHTYPWPAKKRLYRDPDNSMIGGVCAGLGAYFDLDPLLFRIIFIALFFVAGVSIIIYPILWIVLPVAYTAAQKLEMRGEEVTVNNIERTYHKPETIDPNSFRGKIRSFINEFFTILRNIVGAFWKLFVVLFGILLIATSLIFVISIIGTAFLNPLFLSEITGNPEVSLKEFLGLIVGLENADMLIALALIIAAIPLAGLIYAGLKIVIRFKAKDKWIILSLAIIWILAIITGAILVFGQVTKLKCRNINRELVTVPSPKGNLLNFKILSQTDNHIDIHTPTHGFFGISTKNKELYGLLWVEIEKSSKPFPELEIIREAQGVTNEDASISARKIKVNFTLTDTLVSIDPFFWLTEDKQWKIQSVKIVLYLPVNMKLKIDHETKDFFNHHYWHEDISEHTMLMTDEGLRRDYIANSLPGFENTITVKLWKEKHNPKLDSILSDARIGTFKTIDTDSGSYKIGRPLISFKAWTNKSMIAETSPNFKRFTQSSKYQFVDNSYYIPAYWYYKNTPRNRDNGRKPFVTLKIPEGARLYFSEETAVVLQPGDQYLVNHTWLVTKKGLEEVEKK